jgi:hypothetical protein
MREREREREILKDTSKYSVISEKFKCFTAIEPPPPPSITERKIGKADETIQELIKGWSVRLCISANKACGYNKSFDLEFEEDWVLEETEAVSEEVNNDAVEYKVICRFLSNFHPSSKKNFESILSLNQRGWKQIGDSTGSYYVQY